jgi:hypothetical protein
MVKPSSSALQAIKPFVAKIPGARWLWYALPRWEMNARRKWLKLRTGKDYRAAIFTNIWSENAWDGAESRSGPGSDLPQTTIVREQLADLLSQLRVQCLLDIPCGDFHWMKEVLLPPGLIYIGGDIVEPLVIKNNERYRTDTVSFRKLDLCTDALPPADLVLCRDCLVHFSFADFWRAVANLKASGSKYLLATHFTGNRENPDIDTGDWRPLNLTNPPINFPPPLRLIVEQFTEGGDSYRDKSLGLWRIADLPDRGRTV